jgi:hypothetical protein
MPKVQPLRIEEQLAQAVVFLGPDRGNGVEPRGTGFFVHDNDADGLFLVTARHVVEQARATGSLWVQAFRQGELVPVDVSDFDNWHVSDTTDVAVRPFRSEALGDHGFLSTTSFAMPEWLEQNWVGPGDEVFFIGLFAALAKEERGRPIVRFGNISLRSGEPVPITNADCSVSRVVAWLVEARSWGGQSGSPAFVWLQPMRYPGQFVVPAWSGDPGAGGVLDPKDQVHLLGMVVGHFDLKQDVTFASDVSARASVAANSGVAIVIPAEDILREIRAASTS